MLQALESAHAAQGADLEDARRAAASAEESATAANAECADRSSRLDGAKERLDEHRILGHLEWPVRADERRRQLVALVVRVNAS